MVRHYGGGVTQKSQETDGMRAAREEPAAQEGKNPRAERNECAYAKERDSSVGGGFRRWRLLRTHARP